MLGLSLIIAACLIFVARSYINNYTGVYTETNNDDDSVANEGQNVQTSNTKTAELEVLLN